MNNRNLISAYFCLLVVSFSVFATAKTPEQGYVNGQYHPELDTFTGGLGPAIPPVHITDHVPSECPKVEGWFTGVDSPNGWGPIKIWIGTEQTDKGLKYQLCADYWWGRCGSDDGKFATAGASTGEGGDGGAICTPNKTIDMVFGGGEIFQRYRISVISNDIIQFQARDGSRTNVGTNLIEMKRIK